MLLLCCFVLLLCCFVFVLFSVMLFSVLLCFSIEQDRKDYFLQFKLCICNQMSMTTCMTNMMNACSDAELYEQLLLHIYSVNISRQLFTVV